MKKSLIIAVLLVSINTSFAENWKLDARFASLDISKMVNSQYPQLSKQAQVISHYAGFYSINPFLLSEYLLSSPQQVNNAAKYISEQLKQAENNFKNININRIKALMSNYVLMNKKSKATAENMPALDLPFDHSRGWYFNGVHTWTGDDNGDPMSSIDLTRSWGSNWGDNTASDWVAAAHDGIVTRFSSCFIRITHSSGWATDYYHLDNTQFDTGDEVMAGEKIANYADNYAQATCQGGRSSGPHVHFALVKEGERYALNDVQLSKWKIHPGRNSYDTSHNRMWLEKEGVKKYGYQDTLMHLNGDNEIDYRYSGAFSSSQISGHGINIIITHRPVEGTEEVRNIVFIAFYTYDDNGDANFYAGNTDLDNWRADEEKTIPMIQTSGGNFTNLQSIDFDNDVIDAGTISIQYLSCSQINVRFSLLEPVNNVTTSHQMVLNKTIGTPDTVCQAPSI